MTQLIVLVCMYMLVSIGIGLWAARRVRNTADYALAGRSLPLAMVITATFATWFGSETVLGLPGRFIEGGIAGVIEEPAPEWRSFWWACSLPASSTRWTF